MYVNDNITPGKWDVMKMVGAVTISSPVPPTDGGTGDEIPCCHPNVAEL